MPPVTRLEQTDSVIQRIQTFLKKKTVVEHVATFAGQSFPRFYYNVSPQEPDTRYGQLIVITRSANETPALFKTLRSELPELAPEALVMVKELQQDQGFRRSEEHTSELQSHLNLVCRLLLEKKQTQISTTQC